MRHILLIFSLFCVTCTTVKAHANINRNTVANWSWEAVLTDSNNVVGFDCASIGENTNNWITEGQNRDVSADDVSVANLMGALAYNPTNDACSNAIALSCGDAVTGTTVDATLSGMGSASCSAGTPADVFYSLNVQEGTEYIITVLGDDYDAVLMLYNGSCGNLIEFACADNGFSAGMQERIAFTATATETIVIRTYDWSASAGSFTISVDCDDFADCEDPYNEDATNSDVYISQIQIAGIGVDKGNTDYDFLYTSNRMSTDGYVEVTNPMLTIYPGLESLYTLSSGPDGNTDSYYYSLWIDSNQNGCFEAEERILWTDDMNLGENVTEVPHTFSTNLVPGTYQARIRNSMNDFPLSEGAGDGEALDFNVVVITEAEAGLILGVDHQVFSDFNFYPNPVGHEVNLHAKTPIEQVEVYSLLGQQLIQIKPNALKTNLNVNGLQSGVYIMNVTINGGMKSFRIMRK
ncbi:T9SS type A sorting domain-containing protein [Gelidibacter maritimus]|uniref:T9SS type A sorting domain-containing protein n=1 Tax=Gelidibacter maritimus TaxID=2761487 RepID=A0A7W2M3L7_9FLAO|nr:T9SS type A sorting domain-containing protein [Gelidibacter maritimus]MBA6152055.1 T9SS type A sorting domain-containing protein [Gelidibacter maritimus]